MIARLSPIVCLLWIACEGVAFAQSTREAAKYAVDIIPGVRLIRLEYDRTAFRQRVNVLEIHLSAADPAGVADVALEAATANDAVSALPLGDLLEREGALAAFQVVEQRPGPEARTWPGLVAAGGRLIAAPGDGPVLTITPEGWVDLADSAPAAEPAARLSADAQAGASRSEDSTLPIDWINRRLPPPSLSSSSSVPHTSHRSHTPHSPSSGDASGGVGKGAAEGMGGIVLLANPGALRESFLAGCGPLEAVSLDFELPRALRPGATALRAGASALTPWIRAEEGRFRWNSLPLGSSSAASDSPSSAAAIPAPLGDRWTGIAAVGEESAARVRRFFASPRQGILELHTQPEWTDFQAILPLRRWVVRDGHSLAPPDPEGGPMPEARAARSAIGLDRERATLWLAHVRKGERGADGMSAAELADLMLALGAHDAAEGPEGDGAALQLNGQSILPLNFSAERCRLALLVRPRSAAAAEAFAQRQRQGRAERADSPRAAALRLGSSAVSAQGQWTDLTARTRIQAASTAPLDWLVSADRAVDRRQGRLPALDHFWASGGDENHVPTIEFDLLEDRVIGQIDLIPPSNAGFSDTLDFRLIRIATRAGGGGDSWTPRREIRNDPPRLRLHVLFDPPIRARQVRIEFPEPSALPGYRTARLVEAIFWTREP